MAGRDSRKTARIAYQRLLSRGSVKRGGAREKRHRARAEAAVFLVVSGAGECPLPATLLDTHETATAQGSIVRGPAVPQIRTEWSKKMLCGSGHKLAVYDLHVRVKGWPGGARRAWHRAR